MKDRREFLHGAAIAGARTAQVWSGVYAPPPNRPLGVAAPGLAEQSAAQFLMANRSRGGLE